MLNLVRPAFLLSLAITLFVGVNAAHAAPLTAGSDIHVSDGSGNTGGGEFSVVVIGDVATFISSASAHGYINFVKRLPCRCDFDVRSVRPDIKRR